MTSAERRGAVEGVSVGIDVGGTFTDLVAVDPSGRVEARKVLSTPADQSQGVEAALRALSDADRERVDRIVHGTTVATNTLLEHSGARVVLCATKGFTDVLRLRRQDRASLYDLSAGHAPALVDDGAVVPVCERVVPEGVRVALTDTEAEHVVSEALGREPAIVAVALLHAYARPAHEERLAESFARRAPGLDVVLSSRVFPEIREYERTTTTVAEAYLRPGVGRYLARLASRIASLGLPAPGVMTSSGGMRSASEAASSAAQLALSGPAGGVVGAAAVLRAAEPSIGAVSHALTIDIGGTSADVGLVVDGAPLVEPGGRVADVPIALPRVLVETVSAGGDSIGWVDAGGALRVGPRSAGAVPGPAAFERGGTSPTVTDAHVVLGHITSRHLSGGITLSAPAARAALATLAAELGAPVERVAEAMIATADAAMARALRRVSVERGIDPRGCVLVAFGGGGPLHACGLAERVGLARVFVPPHAGVLSAVGLALTSERREVMASIMLPEGALASEALEASARTLASRLAVAGASERAWFLRMRYAGQGHELDVPRHPGDGLDAVRQRFAALHERRYGFTLDAPTELVSLRHVASGVPRPLVLADRSRDEELGERQGPCSIALPDATMRVNRGWSARPLALGGWILERR